MIKKIFRYISRIFKPQVVVNPTPTPPRQSAPPISDEVFADISHHRVIDFKLFDGDHLIFKATEGQSFVDKTFLSNMLNCQTRGINYGVYHFYRVYPDPIAQAKHFINTVGLDNLKLMPHLPIVDFETAKNQTKEQLIADLDDLKKFIKYVNNLTGRKMRIYTGEYLMTKIPFDAEFLELCDLPWIANYTKKPVNCGIWGKYWAWQFAENAHVKGVLKPCDGNYFYGKN